MKLKNFLLTATLMLLVVASLGQTKGILYKSGEWLNIKAKGGWAKAMKDPNYEKVEILQTDKNFKVTLGSKTYNYKIISSNRFSEVMMQHYRFDVEK